MDWTALPNDCMQTVMLHYKIGLHTRLTQRARAKHFKDLAMLELREYFATIQQLRELTSQTRLRIANLP